MQPVVEVPSDVSVTPAAENVTVQAESSVSLRVHLPDCRDRVFGLYVFAGRRRRCNFDHYLQMLAVRACLLVIVVELDLEIDAEHDVTKLEVWLPHKQQLASKHYKFVFATPPL